MQIQQLPNGDLLHLSAGGYRLERAPNKDLIAAQTSQYLSDNANKQAQTQADAYKTAAMYGLQGQQAMAGAQAAQAASNPYSAYAPSAANMYGSYAGLLGQGNNAMGQMYNSYANAFGGYGSALASLANSQANTNANRYGAYAQGNAGFQNMLGSLGAGALGAYGSAANSAMQSQAMRESAAMKMMSDAMAANQSAVASYGGQQAGALASLGNSYANAGTGLGANRAALANSSANLGAAGAGALANVAGNAMNYTRDMGKLDLARTLGIGQINAMGQFASPGGTLNLSGPGGTIASGAYNGSGAAGGSPYSMPNTPSWYSSQQRYDGGGKEAVTAALNQSHNTINAQGAGIGADADRTYAGLADAGSRVGDKSILDSLNSNYASGMRGMMDMYHAGRKDPSDMLQSAFQNTRDLASPFMQAGKDAYAQFLGGMNQPQQGPDMGAYLQSLNSGWQQFQPSLAQQNSNVLAALMAGRNAYNSGFNALGNNMQWATNQVKGPGMAYPQRPTVSQPVKSR